MEIIQPDLNVYRVSALYPQGVLKRYDCYEWLTVSTCAFYMLGLDIESRLHRILSFSWYIVDLVDVKVLFAYYDDASYLLINGTKIFLRACAGFQIHPT